MQKMLKSHLSLRLQVNLRDYIIIWCWLTFVCNKLLFKSTFLQKINVEWSLILRKWGMSCIFPTSSRDTSLCWVPHRTASGVFLFSVLFLQSLPDLLWLARCFFYLATLKFLEGLNYISPIKDLWFGIWFCHSCTPSSLQTNKSVLPQLWVT